MSITVADILELPVMEQATLLAGACGISRTVEGISIMEDNDSAQWIRPNNILLTNGHAILAHADNLQELLDMFSSMQVACITVKRGRKMGKAPQELLDYAERECVPIISLPFEATSSTLISAISYELFRNEAHNLEFSYEIDMLRDLVLENESWNILRNRLATLGWNARKQLGVAVLKRCNNCQFDTAQPGFLSNLGFTYTFPLFGKQVLIAELDGEEHPAAKLKEYAEALDAALLSYCPCAGWRIGVGSPAPNLGQLSSSFKEAMAALCLGIADNARSRVIPLFNTGIFSVLLQPRNQAGTEAVVGHYTRYLKRHDEQYGTELYRTMIVYGQEGKNAKRTAERMYVHVNTVRYRMNAVRTVLSEHLIAENVDVNIDIICTIARWMDAMEHEHALSPAEAKPRAALARS